MTVLARLRRLHQEATPPSWEARGMNILAYDSRAPILSLSAVDAALVVEMRNQLPALLTCVARLEWIADPSYVGNYGVEEVVAIYRTWAREALAVLREQT